MYKIIYTLALALILLVPGSVLVTSTAHATTDFNVFAIGVNNTIHELQLKASQMTNDQVIPASNFAIAPESVVQVRQGQDLVLITSSNEPDRIEKVKVTNTNDVVTELDISPQGYSLQGLATGVYILDVLVDSPNSSNQDAYETILVILGPDQPQIQNITEITKIINSVSVKVKIINKFDNDKDNNNDNKTKPDNKTEPVEGTHPVPKLPGPPINNTIPEPEVEPVEEIDEGVTEEETENDNDNGSNDEEPIFDSEGFLGEEVEAEAEEEEAEESTESSDEEEVLDED